MKSKIAVGSDHRGYSMKEKVKAYLTEKDYSVVDCGTFSEEAVDYSDFVIPAAEKVSRGECARSIGICYTGVGSSIAANKVRGVRAALCLNREQAKLTREHNDSNMLILGAGFVSEVELFPLIDVWLATPFEGGRHKRRIDKITEYERHHSRS